MTSTDITDSTPRIRVSGADTAIFVAEDDHYAVEAIPAYSKGNVQVRLYPGPTSPADRVLVLTADEAKVLGDALHRAAEAVVRRAEAEAVVVPVVHACVDCGGDLSTDLAVCDEDGSNGRHAACDDARPTLYLDEVMTEAENQAVTAQAVARFIDFMNNHPDTPQIGDRRYSFTAEPSGRNYRIVLHDGYNGGGSVHCFIDRTTGDVYKAEGWKRPAKGVRYNLHTQWDLITEVWTWNSGWLYADRVRKG